MHGGAGCACKFRGQWRPEEGVRTLGADLQVQKQKALGTPEPSLQPHSYLPYTEPSCLYFSVSF